jgi:hypothetical protein
MARIDECYSRIDLGAWMPTFTVKDTKTTDHIKRAWYLEDLSFIVIAIAITVSHRMSASAVTSCDSCGTQHSDKRIALYL